MNAAKELLLSCFFGSLLIVARIECTINDYSETLRRDNRLTAGVVNVISRCYLKNQRIVLAGNWSDDDVGTVEKLSNSAVSFYITGTKKNGHFYRHKRFRNVYKMTVAVVRKLKFPVNTFILVIHDGSDLLESLAILKDSILWNHVGDFLVICKNTQDECQSARSFLQSMWSYGILSAILLCHDKSSNAHIYTFNPYTNVAPTFWTVVPQQTDGQIDKSTWTLYRRSLDSSPTNLPGEVSCKELFFDKTRTLGGYTIKAGVSVRPRTLTPNKTKLGLEEFDGLSVEMSSIIWNHLNATLHTVNYVKVNLADHHMFLQRFLRDLLEGKIEVTLNVIQLRDFWKLQTYPQDSEGLCIVSRKRSMHSNLENVLLQPSWLIFYCAVYGCLLGSLKRATKQSYAFAFLEATRVLVNTRVSCRPASVAGKQLLINVMFITMLLRIYFQSYLISFDDLRARINTIDTVDDLVQSDLNVYGTLNYKAKLCDLNIENRYRFGFYEDCLDRLLNGQRLICLASCHKSRLLAYKAETIHISKEIRSYFLSFLTSDDWPLLSRFNQLMMSLNEMGFIAYIVSKESYIFKKRSSEVDGYPTLSLTNLRIIWYFWLIGLTLAAMAFLIEVFWHQMKT